MDPINKPDCAPEQENSKYEHNICLQISEFRIM